MSLTIMRFKPFLGNYLRNFVHGTRVSLKSKICGSQIRDKALVMDNLNPNIIALEYAVRGAVLMRADAIAKELSTGVKKPFSRVIKANLGDAHAMGQPPITFIRDVLSCTVCPRLLKTSEFPDDVKARARALLKSCGSSSVGSYTATPGIDRIRKNIAGFIERRDGYVADWQNIFLCAGASTGIKNILQLFSKVIDGKRAGIMIPIPQYPLYSAAISEFGLAAVGYYLDEEQGWALNLDELERSYKAGSEKTHVRAIVVINPGNPTGQVLTRKNVETIVKFAREKNLFILADEVYQMNIYDKCSEFFSFKKIMCELGDPYCKNELVSFMSASKCYMGECGLRGGWAELVNMDPAVQAQLFKAMSASLCPSSLGQIVMDCVASEPCPGDASYDKFIKEKKQTLQSLSDRATMAYKTLNKMEGFTCNVVQGAMYAFPKITLPPKAIKKAKEKKMKPDVFYCFELLEETGITVVPGSGFGQKPGTYHFRTTILPHPELLKEMLKIFEKFHAKFIKKYS